MVTVSHPYTSIFYVHVRLELSNHKVCGNREPQILAWALHPVFTVALGLLFILRESGGLFGLPYYRHSF